MVTDRMGGVLQLVTMLKDSGRCSRFKDHGDRQGGRCSTVGNHDDRQWMVFYSG